MAIFHSHISPISRGRGWSVIKRAAYICGQPLYDYRLGQSFWHKRQDIRYSEIMLPENAPREFLDRQNLWNKKDFAEKRVDARTAIEVESSIHVKLLSGNPVELDKIVELIRGCLTEAFVSRGRCIDWSIHDKGNGNPHFHALLTDRPVDCNGFCLKKDRDWNRPESFLLWREIWAKEQNLALERKYPERYRDMIISHESYRVQGKHDIVPTKHLGAKVITLWNRDGIETDRLAENIAIMEARKAKDRERDHEVAKELEQHRERERSR